MWLDWVARHTRYEKGQIFEDEQVKGPFKKWKHTHSFIPRGPDNFTMDDEITWELSLSPLGQIVGGRLVRKKLYKMFRYRHKTLKIDLGLHKKYSEKPMHIAITGASGLLGTRLVPFLTTGGHRVSCLVRRPVKKDDEIFWDPAKGILNPDDLKALMP